MTMTREKKLQPKQNSDVEYTNEEGKCTNE